MKARVAAQLFYKIPYKGLISRQLNALLFIGIVSIPPADNGIARMFPWRMKMHAKLLGMSS